MEDEYYDQHNSFKFVSRRIQTTISHNTKPIEYFNLFFTSSLWTMIMEETDIQKNC